MAFIRALLSSQLSFTEKYHELNLSLTILTWWWWLFVFWHFLIEFFKGKLSFKLWEKVLIILDHDASETIYGLKYFQINYSIWGALLRAFSTEFRCLRIRFSLRSVLTLDRNTFNLTRYFVIKNVYHDADKEAMTDIEWNIVQLLKIKYLYFWICIVEIQVFLIIFSTLNFFKDFFCVYILCQKIIRPTNYWKCNL